MKLTRLHASIYGANKLGYSFDVIITYSFVLTMHGSRHENSNRIGPWNALSGFEMKKKS